jgi:hypothetical protein
MGRRRACSSSSRWRRRTLGSCLARPRVLGRWRVRRERELERRATVQGFKYHWTRAWPDIVWAG